MKNSLIILLGMGLLAKTPVEADQKCGDFVYESHDSAVTITKYTGAGDVAVIPPAINDLQVTSIRRRHSHSALTCLACGGHSPARAYQTRKLLTGCSPQATLSP